MLHSVPYLLSAHRITTRALPILSPAYLEGVAIDGGERDFPQTREPGERLLDVTAAVARLEGNYTVVGRHEYAQESLSDVEPRGRA